MLSYQVDEFVATSDRVEVTVNARVYLGVQRATVVLQEHICGLGVEHIA